MLALKAFQNWILILELKLFPFTKTNRKLWNKITIFQLKKIYLKLFSTKRTFIQKDFPPEDGCAGVPALSYEPRSLCIPILQKDDEEDAAIAEDDDEHHHHDATILLLESPCSLLLLIIVGPWKKRIMQTWPCMYISLTGWSCATVSYDFVLTGIKNQINGKTQPYWDIKLSKCPYISFNKMVGFCHLFDFNARQTKIIKHSCTWSPCIRGQGSGSHIFAWCTHSAGQKIYASYVH